MVRISRRGTLASLAPIVMLVLSCEGCKGSGGGGPPSTTGAILASTGFGAVTSNSSPCTGSGNITITPKNLTGTTGKAESETKPFSYSGLSSTTERPACKQDVLFGNLRTGTWEVTNGLGVCTATSTAGRFTTVKIWNGACE